MTRRERAGPLVLAFGSPLGLDDSVSLGDPVVVQLQRRGELMYLAFTLE